MRILSTLLATTLSLAAAAKPVEVMYIVDASYAMTKDLGALTRLEAVQDVLRDAIRHPDRHADLIVRVGGFSEYFGRLSRDLQRTLLERVEHGVSSRSFDPGPP